MALRSRSQRIFIIKVKMFAFKFIQLYHQKLMNFIYLWHDGTCRYRFKVLLREIPVPGHELEVKVTDPQFSYKSLTFCIKVYIAILSRPFD